MADIPNFEQQSPGWRAGGVDPPAAFKAEGFKAGYKPPAGFFNWFWTRVSSCITELQSKLGTYMQYNEAEKAQLTKQLEARTVALESTVTGTVQDISLPYGLGIENIRGVPIHVGGAGDGKSTAPAVSSAALRVNGEFTAPLYLPKPGVRYPPKPGGTGLPGFYIFTEGYTRELPEGWSDFGYTAVLTKVPEWEEGEAEPAQYFDAFVMERPPLAEQDSGWVEAELLNGFTVYSNGSQPRYRRSGNVVEVRGALSPPAGNEMGTGTRTAMFRLPEGFRPDLTLSYVAQGTDNHEWELSISSNGDVRGAKYRLGATPVTPTPSTWLPFNATFLIG